MLLPKKIKCYLESNRVYLKLRYSRLIYALWLRLRADVRKEILLKEWFYSSVLPKNCKLIFDIGANEGVMTNIFRKHSQLVVAVEPSQRNAAILSARFRNQKNVVIVAKAISNVSGYQYWYEDKSDYAMGTLSAKWNESKPNIESITSRIETVTLDDLILKFGSPDYLKIDVEGYEQQALEGLSHSLPLLSFEAILPRFLDETACCINHLLTVDPSYVFNYSIDHTLAYKNYKKPSIILNDIKNIQQTVDIFCKR